MHIPEKVAEKMVSDALKWRRTYYLFFILIFLISIIALAILISEIPKYVYCQSDVRTCVGYENNRRCIAQTNTNGGTNCLTKCESSNGTFICSCPSNSLWVQGELSCVLKCKNNTHNTDCADYPDGNNCLLTSSANNEANCKAKCDSLHETFICSCPSNSLWVQNELSCVLKCMNDTHNTDCADYPDGNNCLLTSTTNNETNCKTLCNGTNGRDFVCSCDLDWDPVQHYCNLCPFDYTLFYNSRTCFRSLEINESYLKATSLCNATRIHLPIIQTMDMLNAFYQYTIDIEVTNSWLSIECIDNVWYWRKDYYQTLIRVTNFFGSSEDCSTGNHAVFSNIDRYWFPLFDGPYFVICQYDIP